MSKNNKVDLWDGCGRRASIFEGDVCCITMRCREGAVGVCVEGVK